MSASREQLDRPTFKGLKFRRRRSDGKQKTAFRRALRRDAKRDPEGAPRKRQFSGWFWSVLLLLCLCGCVGVKPVVPPGPGPDAATEMDRWLESLRATTWQALDDTERAVSSSTTDDEALYRSELGKNLENAARAARGELSSTDQALSDSGYTRAKALELLARRKMELRRGQ